MSERAPFIQRRSEIGDDVDALLLDAECLTYYINAAGVVNVAGDGKFVSGSHTAGYAVVNASVALESDAQTWRVTADCSNRFNKVWSQSSVSGYSFITPPGTWALRVKRKF